MNGVLEAVGGKVSGGRALTFDDVQALAGVSDLVRLVGSEDLGKGAEPPAEPR